MAKSEFFPVFFQEYMKRLDDLQTNNLKIYQDSDKYCFTSDATHLANFILPFAGAKMCEFGAGTGVISILVAGKNKLDFQIDAVEIQKDAFELLQENILINNLANSITPYHKDIREISGKYDIIFSNPPYFKVNSNEQSKNENIRNSRCENLIDINSLAKCASENLKDDGKFYLCFPAFRLAELFYKLKCNRLEPKLVQGITKSLSAPPHTYLICAKKNAKEEVRFLPPKLAN